jgi:chaperonin cofactor prefoldin
MENQALLNIAICSSLAILGWFARQLWEATQNLKDDLKKIEVDMPTHYVRKSDIDARFDKLEAKLDMLFERIDRKADK